jgi:SpoVK/Ycf46/Vps4 family AAA+-type ATPase
MSKKEIYKSQDELIGEWLDYLERYQSQPNLKFERHKSVQKDFKAQEDLLWKRAMNAIEKGIVDDNPLLKFIKDNNLTLTEFKVILSLYLEYLRHGESRIGSTLLCILEDVVDNSKIAYLERKKILERNVLFSSNALIKEEPRNPFMKRGDIYTLSPEMISILEGEELVLEEEEDSNSHLFEIIEPEKSLKDVVLTENTRKQIEIILKQIENRDLFFEEWGFRKKYEKGKGLIVIFYGPPGTGKTLTAEVIAHHLKYKLYIVSLSDVMNCYYGVTEKNIKRIFEIAAKKDCILLLDEVDAFISSRSKGGTYMDSQHNREVSLFLRLIENFNGVAILTTNLPDVLDFALKRRISIKIEFPKPDVHMRQKLWKTLIPEELPLSRDIDFEELARNFDLTGGEIKNVIMNAARLALFRKSLKVNEEDFVNAAESEMIIEEEKAGFL